MRENYIQREVCVDAIRPLLDELAVGAGTDLSGVVPEAAERISWECLCELLDAYGARPEADPQTFGARALSGATYKFCRRMRFTSRLLTLEDALRYILYPRNPIDFSCITTAIAATDGRVDIVAYLSSGYRPNRVFWDIMLGAARMLVSQFGLRDADVTLTTSGNDAHFAFAFALQDGVASKARKLSSRMISAVALRAVVLKSYPDLVAGRKLFEEESIRRAKIALRLESAEKAFEKRLARIDEVIAEFDEQGAWVYASPNLERLIGQSMEAAPEDFARIVHSEDLARVRESFAAAVLQERCDRIDDFRVVDSDGRTRWVELEFTRYEVAENVARTIAIGRDTTERREHLEERRALDSQLEQTQRLEMLGVLAGGVAHDFNNLLVPILGQAELAALQLNGSSELLPRIETIRTAAEKASDLVRQLMLYAGSKPSKSTRVDLARETDEMLVLASSSFASGIEVRKSLAEGAFVSGDPAQLRQVIMNLLVNAGEAIKDGSGHIDVGVDVEPGMVVLSVADDGCGMDQQTQERVFQPFYTTKFTGRGLGLSAVLGIVRAHQGELLLDSSPGQGSRFELRLPAAAVADGEKDTGESLAARFAGKVLLVDDEAAARVTGREILERLGFAVELACDGAEALDCLSNGSYDVALVDLVMPRVDGREVLSAIRRDTPALPVIIVSGFGAWSSVTEFKADPYTRFLGKPYGIQELVKTLAELPIEREAGAVAT